MSSSIVNVHAASKTMYVKASALNMRSGPGTKYKTITTVKKNQSVTLTQQKGSWGKVKANKKTGWVSMSYLTSKKPVTSKTMYITGNTPLKASAKSSAKTLVNTKSGGTITVYSTTSGSYYKAKVSNKTGWILKSKVSDTKKVRSTKKESVGYKTVKQNDSTLLKGTEKVSRNGKRGTRTKIIEQTYRNGKLISTKTISSKVTTQPIDKIIKVGTKPIPQARYLNTSEVRNLLNGSSLLKHSPAGIDFWYKDDLYCGRLAEVEANNSRVTRLHFENTTFTNFGMTQKDFINLTGDEKEGKTEYTRYTTFNKEAPATVKLAVESIFGKNAKESTTLYNEVMKYMYKEWPRKEVSETKTIGGHKFIFTHDQCDLWVKPQ